MMFDKFVFSNEKISNETMDFDLISWSSTPCSSPTMRTFNHDFSLLTPTKKVC